jgi:hypothetical protein
VLDHGLGPADQLARILRRRFVEQDLEPALQRFVGVVGADRVPLCGAPQHRLVAREGLDRDPHAHRRLDRRCLFFNRIDAVEHVVRQLNVNRGAPTSRSLARTHWFDTPRPVYSSTANTARQGLERGGFSP